MLESENICTILVAAYFSYCLSVCCSVFVSGTHCPPTVIVQYPPHYATPTRGKGERKTFPRQNLINRVWFNTNSWLMLSASQPKNLSEVSALVFSSRRLTRPPGSFHLRSTRCPPAGSVAGCWTRPPSSLNIQPGWPVPSSRPPQPRLLPDRSKSPRSAWRPPHPSTWSAPHSSSLDRGRRSRNDW